MLWPFLQTTFSALNLCLAGLSTYQCAGNAVTATVCGNTAMATTATCQATTSSPLAQVRVHALPKAYKRHSSVPACFLPACLSAYLPACLP